MKRSRLWRSARAYAATFGWPVFPLRPRSKSPLIPIDRGGRGYLDASTDIATIDRWWSMCPDANVGIACDERSGLLALDIDPRSGGDEELDALIAQHGELPETVTALTGGGGVHYLYQRPDAPRFKGKLGPGIDIKGAGYIVAAPSVHPNGSLYHWEASSRPGDVEIAELPMWVLARVVDCTPSYGQPAGDVAKSFLALAFGHAGWLGRRVDAVRVCVMCPWEHEHTTRSPDSATVLFAPREGSSRGWFHCAHAHCAGQRTLDDVLGALPMEAICLASYDLAMTGIDDDGDVEREAIMTEGSR